MPEIELIKIKPCFAYEIHRMRLMTDKEYREKRLNLKEFVMDFRNLTRWRGLSATQITIPVVVHIVRGPNDKEVTDERIIDQIDALNEDFSMRNDEIGFTGYQYKYYGDRAAATNIQFALAKRTPDCEDTDGIIRTETKKTSFNAVTRHTSSNNTILDMSDADLVKSPPDGQIAWPRDQYLNIWVCNFTVDGEPYSGSADFPGAPAELDGVIVSWLTFGREKNILAPRWGLPDHFNRGRSLTHEVAHWLNLYHIACDHDPPNCDDSDLVMDTPNQRYQSIPCPHKESDEHWPEKNCVRIIFRQRNFQCSAVPHASCSKGSRDNPIDARGDMFMNIMDYTQDPCRFMFTAGQAARMNTTLNGPRHSLFASDGLVPVSVVGRYGLWIRHSPDDFSLEPDIFSEILTDSDDIWANHPYPFVVYDHDNPRRGEECTVFVRVRNSSCLNIDKYLLKLYWAIGTTGLGWPSPWNDPPDLKTPRGGLIGTQYIGSVGPHGFKVLSFKWTPPALRPKAPAQAEEGGFSFLARIVDPEKPNDGMTVPEGPNLLENIRNNNKIAMKSVTVLRMVKDDRCNGTLFVGIEKKPFPVKKVNTADSQLPLQRLRLSFSVPEDRVPAVRSPPGSILDWADVYADLGKELFLNWEISGKPGEGVEEWKGYVVKITRSNAWIDLHVKPGKHYPVDLLFKRKPESPEGYYVFRFDAIQQERVPGGLAAFGGRRFIVKTFYRGQPIE